MRKSRHLSWREKHPRCAKSSHGCIHPVGSWRYSPNLEGRASHICFPAAQNSKIIYHYSHVDLPAASDVLKWLNKGKWECEEESSHLLAARANSKKGLMAKVKARDSSPGDTVTIWLLITKGKRHLSPFTICLSRGCIPADLHCRPTKQANLPYAEAGPSVPRVGTALVSCQKANQVRTLFSSLPCTYLVSIAEGFILNSNVTNLSLSFLSSKWGLKTFVCLLHWAVEGQSKITHEKTLWKLRSPILR